MKLLLRSLILGGILVLASAVNSENLRAQTVPASEGPKSGQKVVFLGDSITAAGTWPAGYLNLVGEAFQHEGRPIVIVNAGVSGDTSTMMLARLKRDVLDQKPDWMTLSCGVNDVWGRSPGGAVPLDQFKKNVTSIVDQATAAGIKIVILTPNRIGEVLPRNSAGVPFIDSADGFTPYNEFLHAFAKERNLPLADIRGAEDAKLLELSLRWPHSGLGPYLTIDGTHMSPLGNEMMASTVLKAMAFSDAQIAQAQAQWLDVVGGFTSPAQCDISLAQLDRLNDLAEKKGMPVTEMLRQAFQQALVNLANQPLPVPKSK